MGGKYKTRRIGSVLQDRYRIVNRLEEGRTSIVYRGERLLIGRPVAIKFLHPSLQGKKEHQRRFEWEARITGQLNHPNCVSVLDYGKTDLPYFVMDLLPGRTLDEIITQQSIESQRAIEIVIKVLMGLDHAHKKGIVHRDLRPENIMVTEVAYSDDHVRVIDFGLASFPCSGPMEAKSLFSRKETIAYKSPEQLRGGEVDERTDLYSAGVVLYQLLTGSKPFEIHSRADLAKCHSAPAPALNSRRAIDRYSPELEAVVAKALALEPKNRYRGAEEFAAALSGVPEARSRATDAALKWPSTTLAQAVTETVPDSALLWNVLYRKQKMAVISAVALLAFVVGVFWGIENNKVKQPAIPAPMVPHNSIPDQRKPEMLRSEAQPGDKIADLSKQQEPKDTAPLETDAQAQTDVTREEILEIRRREQKRIAQNANVMPLIHEGRLGVAIVRLKALEEQYPQNAYVKFILGNIYSEQHRWDKALKYYHETLQLDNHYRNHKVLVSHVVRALNDQEALPQAFSFIKEQIDSAAIPELRRVIAGNYSPRLKERAQDLLFVLTSS